MSSSKNLQRDFAACAYLSEAETPSPYTHCICTCLQYTYSHREGGGRVEPERRGEGQQISWVENTSMTDCISSS